MTRLLLAALAACAAAPPPAARPMLRGMHPELAFFVGTWHAEAHDPSTGKRFELDYEIAPALGGRWYVGRGSAPALGLEIQDVWGKDAVTGEIVRTVFDSAQTFGTVRSRGWAGDVLVFEGEAATTSGRIAVRETITRVGPDRFEAVWEARTGDTWSPYSVETLRRVR